MSYNTYMYQNERPIGVFDSGLGGLTVVKELVKILPHEDIVYLGDTARVPYGPRGVETIKKFSEENTKFLIGQKVKAVVVACNTSSAVAAGYLRRKFRKTPIFEVIRPASVEAVRNGTSIGVIGTRATINSHAYLKNISRALPQAKVIEKACPLFVPFIEEGETDGEALKIIAGEYLSDFKKQKIDTLVLGCTHYPIIRSIISGIVGKNVTLINPGKSAASEVFYFLKKNNLLNEQKRRGTVNFYVTDLTDRFTKVAEMFLGKKIKNDLKVARLEK